MAIASGSTDTPATSARGRALKRPRQVYEPPSDFEDEEESAGESLGSEEEEEEDEEDTDLSGFIAPDDENEDTDDDASYVPDEDEEEDWDSDDSDDVADPMVVTRDNLIDRLMEFSEKKGLDADDEAHVLSQMVLEGYKFPFLKESDQLRLFPYYKNKRAPATDLVKKVFRLD